MAVWLAKKIILREKENGREPLFNVKREREREMVLEHVTVTMEGMLRGDVCNL